MKLDINDLAFKEKLNPTEALERLRNIKPVLKERYDNHRLYGSIYADDKGVIVHTITPGSFLTSDSFIVIEDKKLSQKVLDGYIKRPEIISAVNFLVRHDFISAIKNAIYYIYDDFSFYKNEEIQAVPYFIFNNEPSTIYSLGGKCLNEKEVWKFFVRLFDLEEGPHSLDHSLCFISKDSVVERNSVLTFIAKIKSADKVIKRLDEIDDYIKNNDGAITSSIYEIVVSMLKNKPIEYILWKKE